MSSQQWKRNGKVSSRQSEDVSEIVEAYLKFYQNTERKALRRLILLEYEDVNTRTLDRHLKKAFKAKMKLETAMSKQRTEDSWPKISWIITQGVLGNPRQRRELPSVGFNINNLNDYQVRVRIEARVFLGGRDLGLVDDSKGYYNGKAKVNLEPFGDTYSGLGNGSFSVPQECVTSNEELAIEVRIKIFYLRNRVYEHLPRGYAYSRKDNAWFLEPKAFAK